MTDKITNENTDYEKFAQEIYQTLLDNEDIKPIKVQHNVDLVGRSGCKHQIDVYWEYELAGVIQKVAIECKNYNTSNISIGKIRDFYGVLSDIGNINGIFVCKKSYQSGAIKYAGFYGVNLMELRIPTKEDMKGRLETIQLNLSALNIEIKKRETLFDNDWFKENHPSPSKDQHFEIRGNTDEIIIQDKAGNKIKTLYELDNQLPHKWKDENDKKHEYKWDDAYINIEGLGPVKLLSLKYQYDIQMTEPEEIIISGKDTAKAILKDVTTGDIKFFDKSGNVK